MKQRIPNTTVYLDTADFNQLTTPIDTDLQLSNRIIVSKDRNGNDINQTINGNLTITKDLNVLGEVGVGTKDSKSDLNVYGDIVTNRLIRPFTIQAFPAFGLRAFLILNPSLGGGVYYKDKFKDYLTEGSCFDSTEADRIISSFSSQDVYCFFDSPLTEAQKDRLQGNFTAYNTTVTVSVVTNIKADIKEIGLKDRLDLSYDGYFNTLTTNTLTATTIGDQEGTTTLEGTIKVSSELQTNTIKNSGEAQLNIYGNVAGYGNDFPVGSVLFLMFVFTSGPTYDSNHENPKYETYVDGTLLYYIDITTQIIFIKNNVSSHNELIRRVGFTSTNISSDANTITTSCSLFIDSSGTSIIQDIPTGKYKCLSVAPTVLNIIGSNQHYYIGLVQRIE